MLCVCCLPCPVAPLSLNTTLRLTLGGAGFTALRVTWTQNVKSSEGIGWRKMGLWIFDGFDQRLLADSLFSRVQGENGLFHSVWVVPTGHPSFQLAGASATFQQVLCLHTTQAATYLYMLSSTVTPGQSICSGKCVVRWKEVQYMGYQLGGRQVHPR